MLSSGSLHYGHERLEAGEHLCLEPLRLTEGPVRSLAVGSGPVIVTGGALGDVSIVRGDHGQDPVCLPAHPSAVTAVAVFAEPATDAIPTALLVCSASKSSISLCRLPHSGGRDSVVENCWVEACCGIAPTSACFDPSGHLVAVAVGRAVLVLRTEKGQTLARLEGHDGDVTCVSFDPSRAHILASCSDDGNFKIWDLAVRVCVWDGCLGSSPLAAVAFHPKSGALCVSSTDGKLALYRCGADGDPSHMVEVCMLTLKPAQEGPAGLMPNNRPEFELRVDSHSTVLDLSFMQADNDTLVVVARSDGLWLVDCAMRRCHSFSQDHSSWSSSGPFSIASLQWPSPFAALASALDPSCFLIPITRPLSPFGASSDWHQCGHNMPPACLPLRAAAAPSSSAPADGGCVLSLFPDTEVPASSPLKADFLNRVKASVNKNVAYDSFSTTPTKRNGPGPPPDRPVVFHRKVRSSGYGSMSPSWGKPGGPKPKLRTKSQTPPPGASKTPPASNKSRPLLRLYPTECGPLTRYQPQNDPNNAAAHASAPLLAVAFAEDAQNLAAAALDGTVHLYRLPIAKHKGEGVTLLGHTSAVRSVCMSHDSTMVLSASDDGSARLWALNLSRKSPAVIIKPPGQQAAIPQAAFFYLDKFVLIASGHAVQLIQYQIDLLPRDALIRQPSPGKTKIAFSFTHDHAQKVTSFDCLNGVLSPVVVSACSDRSLCVLDAAKGVIARTIMDAHSKPIHTVALPRPTAYSDLPQAAFDVFATAATDNVITIWDVRSNVARSASFREGHVNRRERLGLALSPCMRYLAAGSENRTTCIYDLRTGRPLHKLQGHVDVVSCVAFNPLHPQLVTGSYDGQMRFYTEETRDAR